MSSTPAATSPSTISTRLAGFRMVFSFCNPSRGPTSKNLISSLIFVPHPDSALLLTSAAPSPLSSPDRNSFRQLSAASEELSTLSFAPVPALTSALRLLSSALCPLPSVLFPPSKLTPRHRNTYIMVDVTHRLADPCGPSDDRPSHTRQLLDRGTATWLKTYSSFIEAWP